MIRVLVLDFDGLLVESEAIKDAAFIEVFADWPQHHETIRRYTLAHRHLVRYAKFRHIRERILGLPYTPQDEERIAAVFTGYTRAQIIACPYVRGGPEFLEYFDGRAPMYLASATPRDELVPIVEARDIARYFKGIFGAPAKKPEVLRQVMREEGVRPEELIFIGDSHADLKAAREVGAAFVARNREDDFSGYDVPRFDDLVGIRGYVAPLVECRCEGRA